MVGMSLPDYKKLSVPLSYFFLKTEKHRSVIFLRDLFLITTFILFLLQTNNVTEKLNLFTNFFPVSIPLNMALNLVK